MTTTRLDKGKLIQWMTIGIIATFFIQMFIVLTYSTPPQANNQTIETPVPMPFSGIGLAQANVTYLSDKVYFACQAINATPTQIEQKISQSNGILKATWEAGALYSARLDNQTLADAGKLSLAVQEVQLSLLDSCNQTTSSALREGLITLIHGTSCENPFEDFILPAYAGKTAFQSQQGNCKNVSFTQTNAYLKNAGKRGIPVFTDYRTQTNTNITVRLNAQMIDTRVTNLIADEFIIPTTQQETPTPLAPQENTQQDENQTQQANQTSTENNNQTQTIENNLTQTTAENTTQPLETNTTTSTNETAQNTSTQ